MLYTMLILILPLFMFLLLGLAGHKMKPIFAGILGTIGLSVVTLLSYFTAFQYFTKEGIKEGVFQTLLPFDIEWLKFTESLQIKLGVLLDPISIMMLIVITTVSLMVHLYSLGYMKNERGFQRYYAFLSLFTFSMLGLVVASNIFQMYIFWELVGVSSYLLIGFYYTKPSAVLASKKAFIVTRFADFFFLIGILLVSYYSGSFDFSTLTEPSQTLLNNTAGISFMGLSVLSWGMMLIFMGGAGKSALLPFHIWLPDAMEGPTPVSALIHAATMVVAGVYLVARLFPLYYLGTPEVLNVIAYIGMITSLFAAIVACTQTDIKRVLAFSTISQIAYMITALGVSGYNGQEGLGYMASMFHLFTHAFFKALLFLGAGAVIHAVHSNEMKDMGGLRKYLPITHLTFLIACLAIAGIPPFSGFFSKDEILVAAFQADKILFTGLFIGAGLTAFYMFRLYYSIFWGESNKVYEKEPLEAPYTMTIPLVILALITVFSGIIPFSKYISADMLPFDVHIHWSIASASILIALIGIAVATVLYKTVNNKPTVIAEKSKTIYQLAYHKFYFDEVWMFVTKNVIFRKIAAPIAWFDRHIIDGFMDSLAKVSNYTSRKIKFIQSGILQDYLFVFIASVLLIVLLLLLV